MSNEQQTQVRVVYSNGRPDSIFAPYRTFKDAENMATKAKTYAHVFDVIVELYYPPET